VIDDDQLKQLFRLIDGDGTGTIDYEEFNDYLTNDMLALADEFGGESVLDNALKRIAVAIGTSGTKAKKLFDKIDLDGDGQLTVRELERAVCSLSEANDGTSLTHEEAAAIVALCDVNGDGAISREEFLAALQASAKAAMEKASAKPDRQGDRVGLIMSCL
jgi:Ca2+-binding EF-hand superfamily protein